MPSYQYNNRGQMTKSRRKYKKKRNGNGGRRYYRKATIGKTLFGNKRVVKLRYQDNFISLTGGLGTPNDRVFSANGIFDPDISLGGHQPRGFDQIMPLFAHYTVVGSKASATFSFQTDVFSAICAIVLRDNATIFTQTNDIMEDRNSKYAIMQTGGPTVLVQKGFSPKPFFSISKPLSSQNIRGSISSNPMEQGYYHVTVSNSDVNNLTSVPVNVNLVIDYVVVFHEPQSVGQS